MEKQQDLAQKWSAAQSVIQLYAPYKNKNEFQSSKIADCEINIDKAYTLIDMIGEGSYGQVTAACYHGQIVAIKKLQNVFEHRIICKRALRELKLLRLLKHDNIIGIKKILLPESREKFDNVYIEQEAMDMDLSQIIKDTQSQLNYEEIEFFVYQILRALRYMHSANVIHRDLNILVNNNCDLKVADLGLARVLIPNQTKRTQDLTGYMQTRWYRAPELLLSTCDYSFSIDVWSVGMIFAELLLRRPLVRGMDTQEQIKGILKIIGSPSEIALQSMNINSDQFYEKFPLVDGCAFERLFSKTCASKEAIDLLRQMLLFDCRKRISINESIQHPCFSHLFDPDEDKLGQPMPESEFEFENCGRSITIEQYKDLMYEEALLYHYPEFRKAYDRKVKEKQSVIEHILSNDNQYKELEEQEQFDVDQNTDFKNIEQ